MTRIHRRIVITALLAVIVAVAGPALGQTPPTSFWNVSK